MTSLKMPFWWKMPSKLASAVRKTKQLSKKCTEKKREIARIFLA